METHNVTVATTDTEPDFETLRSMLSDKPAEAAPATEPEPVTEPVKEASDVAEAASEPAEPKTEPEDVEPELPEGVKKRIAKESEKQAKIQAEINRAVSARKAKEDELKQLSGSEPVQNTAKAEPSNGEPTAPDPNDFPTWGEYLAADRSFRADWSKWLQSETRKTVESEFTAKQAAEESNRAWSEAAKAHSDLREMADTVIAVSPEHLQLAISALDNWADVTVHLGKNPVELEALVRAFKTNPYKGVADLGKLEARLTTDSTKTEAPKGEKPLPAPLKPVAGSASASAPKVDLEKADDATFMKEIRRMTKVG